MVAGLYLMLTGTELCTTWLRLWSLHQMSLPGDVLSPLAQVSDGNYEAQEGDAHTTPC